MRAGVVAAVVANTMGGKRNDGRSYQPSDFFPSLKTNESLAVRDEATIKKETEANINAMKMFTWQLQSQGFEPDPDLTPTDDDAIRKLMQVEMPAE